MNDKQETTDPTCACECDCCAGFDVASGRLVVVFFAPPEASSPALLATQLGMASLIAAYEQPAEDDTTFVQVALEQAKEQAYDEDQCDQVEHDPTPEPVRLTSQDVEPAHVEAYRLARPPPARHRMFIRAVKGREA